MKRYLYIGLLCYFALLSTKCEKLTNEPEVSFDITNTSTKDYSEVKYMTKSVISSKNRH